MRSAIAMMVAVILAGAMAGCGGSSSPAGSANPPPIGGTTPPAGPPTDFAMFVTQQVNQPNLLLATAPVATSALTSDLQLDNASAFASAFFGPGNAVPAGVNLAATACAQAGKASCNPGTSADLNSALN